MLALNIFIFWPHCPPTLMGEHGLVEYFGEQKEEEKFNTQVPSDLFLLIVLTEQTTTKKLNVLRNCRKIVNHILNNASIEICIQEL